jgi:hypothetical protein
MVVALLSLQDNFLYLYLVLPAQKVSFKGSYFQNDFSGFGSGSMRQ